MLGSCIDVSLSLSLLLSLIVDKNIFQNSALWSPTSRPTESDSLEWDQDFGPGPSPPSPISPALWSLGNAD